jgi:hypothetical protein
MKHIERVTCMDTMQGKGKDIVFVVDHGRVIAKHIENIDGKDYGGAPYAG